MATGTAADSAAVIASGKRPWKRGLLWLLFLAPFFFASYGFATWVSARHPAVGVIVFDWERRIPFLQWTIVPYWLIDILYGVSLVLCVTRRELDTHVRRLITAQLIAVLCFLAFPLRFSFDRGELTGSFAWMFDVLMGFDQPFNQAPSLHIALLIILWPVYLRAVPRMWHWVVHATFILIGLSALTTWQHHFVDVPGGIWLGSLCLWLFPDEGRSPFAQARFARDATRLRLALGYASGALGLALFALWEGGAWLWLLWMSGSLALVALIYAIADETAFQKRADGSIEPASLWLMAPYFVAAWINSRLWTRKRAASNAVTDGILLGRIPTRRERDRQRVAAIVDVSAELPCPAHGVRYANAPMLDLVAPDSEQIERASIAIEEARRSGTVLVCCALGYSRSAVAVIAWLVRTSAAESLDDAIAQVRRARPAVALGPGHLAALREWNRRYAALPS